MITDLFIITIMLDGHQQPSVRPISRPIPFPNTPLPAFPPPPVGVEDILPIPLTVCDSQALFQDSTATTSWSRFFIAPVLRFRRQPLSRFREMWIIGAIVRVTPSK